MNLSTCVSYRIIKCIFQRADCSIIILNYLKEPLVKMMERMGSVKPGQLKETCERESKYHKAKIVCFSFLMFGIGTTVQTYF